MANVIEIMNEIVNDTDVLSVKSSSDVLDDGYVGKLSGLVNGEMDLYNFAKGQATDPLVIIAGADVYTDSYGNRVGYKDPRKITYPANRPVRAYRPRVGMRFKINTDAISGTPVKGQYVIPQDNNYQLVAATDLTSHTSGLALEVEDAEAKIMIGKTLVDATVLRVIRV
jgi:hypothetical protein